MTLIIVKIDSKTVEIFYGRGSGTEEEDCTACLEVASQVIREGLKYTTKRPNGI